MEPQPPAARVLPCAGLSAEDWAPFGWLPVGDTDPADGAHTLEFGWADPHLNVISHSQAEVVRSGPEAVVTEMFRHDTHTQALTAIDARGMVAVAPASVGFDGPEDLTAIRAFVIEPLQSLVLHRGTWHWGPYPVGGDLIRLLNVQGWRYREDNTRVDLRPLGAVLVEAP